MAVLNKIAEQIDTGFYEEAVGNLCAFFDRMTRLGEPSQYLTDAAVELYCHLRQRDDLPQELAEDMDNHLLLWIHQTGLFGDWSLSLYGDMLSEGAYQTDDYSCWSGWEVTQAF